MGNRSLNVRLKKVSLILKEFLSPTRILRRISL